MATINDIRLRALTQGALVTGINKADWGYLSDINIENLEASYPLLFFHEVVESNMVWNVDEDDQWEIYLCTFYIITSATETSADITPSYAAMQKFRNDFLKLMHDPNAGAQEAYIVLPEPMTTEYFREFTTKKASALKVTFQLRVFNCYE